MKTFTVESDHRVIVEIDSGIYSKDVVAKVVYWLSRDFTIMQSLESSVWTLSLESHDMVNWDDVKERLSQLLTDYQMREVITAETKDIKNILYIKAFANVEELLSNEEV
ncbi:MAG: His-Xaa-Ser system protein HxsD [Bacteroidaceae bacterium]|nr:His-Xaa-Ser system protein HxsD [Bacteroidaceae bacterium]